MPPKGRDKAIIDAMAVLATQTEAQTAALFTSTWLALAKGRTFDETTIRDILSDARSQIGPGVRTGMIDTLQRKLFPPH